MKYVVSAFLILYLTGSAISGPPEPPAPPDIEEQAVIARAALDSARMRLELEKSLTDLKIKEILEKLDTGVEISELSIAGDSIVLHFSNDSILILSDLGKNRIRTGTGGKDVFHVGGNTVVEEDEIIRGDIVSAFGDVTVKGTVDGGVLTLSGNIYVTSTGNIRDGAFALSGKVKKEPMGKIGNFTWDASYPSQRSDYSSRQPLKIMGMVLFLVFLVWMILSATCASIFKKNITVVMTSMKASPVSSFFKGYLYYVLSFLTFLVLAITVLGIPVAVLAVPIVTIAGMILSFTAASIAIGRRILHDEQMNFRIFLYGSLAMGAVPGLFFLTLMMTGSIVVMVFCWIFVFFLLAAVLPAGLGAALSTRFGIKPQTQGNPPPTSGQ